MPAPAVKTSPSFERKLQLGPFIRGNLHTHTNRSDGDSSPARVASWYRDHGYQFLALTDHNLVTDLSLTREVESKDFVVISGEEVSMWHAGKQVHVNALCTTQTIGGGDFKSASDALLRGIREVQMQGGIALINHPNFDQAISPADIPAFQGASFIEIFSGHGYVQSQGDSTRPSHEALWDMALSQGIDLMGAAIDDMHHLEICADPPANPGKGWVYVSVAALTPEKICAELKNARIVSSTGPAIRRVLVSNEHYEVEPEDDSVQVVFLGRGGKVLSSGSRRYILKGGEGYVRARLDSKDGEHAWTPAVRVVL